MSVQARQQLVTSGHLFFQDGTQSSDLLDPSLTQTELIALLQDLVTKGFHIELTSVRTDHKDDSDLGLHCHANGYCADLWPLTGPTPGDYLDASDPVFAQFLASAADSVWLYQIGLGGSAYTPANVAAAGPTVFQDDDEDHIHLGAN
jgi:hypothetical protein